MASERRRDRFFDARIGVQTNELHEAFPFEAELGSRAQKRGRKRIAKVFDLEAVAMEVVDDDSVARDLEGDLDQGVRPDAEMAVPIAARE